MKSRLEMLAVIDCDEGHELMLQGNDSVSVAKCVEYKTNEVSEKSPDCLVCSTASGSKRQRHNCNQQHGPGQAVQQTVQETRVERGKEKQEEEEKGVGEKRKKEERESLTGRKKGEELREKESRERKSKRRRSRRT